VVGVQQWAEIRRMAEVEGLSQREINRRTGLHRKTIRRALRSDEPPSYSRPPRGSKLDPFKDEINRLLKADPRIPSQRIRELIAALGFDPPGRLRDQGQHLHACPRWTGSLAPVCGSCGYRSAPTITTDGSYCPACGGGLARERH